MSACCVLETVGVEDGDAAAGEADQTVVGVVAQHLGAGLAGGARKGGELFVGEGDLRVPSAGQQGTGRGLGGGEGGQGGGDALGDGFEDAVGQALFEVGEAAAEDGGDAGGDSGVGE
jgi:hypothetical protein